MSRESDLELIRAARAAECRVEGRHDLDPYYTYEGKLVSVVCSRCSMSWRTIPTGGTTRAEDDADARDESKSDG